MINLKKNKYGFYQLVNKPSEQDLQKFYSKKYYQNNKGNYKKNYSNSDKVNLFQKYELIFDTIKNKKNKNLLDLGCGEGFVLDYFYKKEFNVQGIDFSDYGIKKHNKKLLKFAEFGDLYKLLNIKIKKKQSFDVFFASNILEHLNNLEKFFKYLNMLSISKKSYLVVIVPNDFSFFQKSLLKKNKIKSRYWICPPEHISYFSLKSLNNFISQKGWKLVDKFSDFPIEWFLSNRHSNYKEKKIGKDIFEGIKFIETTIYKNNKKKNIKNFYKSIADIGMGRNITCIFKKK